MVGYSSGVIGIIGFSEIAPLYILCIILYNST